MNTNMNLQCHFGDEHAREWVYAMEACTSLAEAADRLRTHTATHLRHERIQLLSHDDVSLVNSASLDESVAYIQMTHVQPVHTSHTDNIQLPKQQSTASLVD